MDLTEKGSSSNLVKIRSKRRNGKQCYCFVLFHSKELELNFISEMSRLFSFKSIRYKIISLWL